MQLLVSVDVVLRARADTLLGCDEVAQLIDSFIDESARWKFRAAVTRGDVRLVQRLVAVHDALEALSSEEVSAALVIAARDGRLDIIAGVHALKGPQLVLTAQVMDTAATHGQLELLQWLHTHRPRDGCSTEAMDGAACHGHLHVLQWLHTHRSEGCTTQAMDGAAARGRLQIVKWLHAHRSEGCTTRAMDGAAAAGALDVLRWLHAHRAEGCTAEAMNAAASEGHLHIVRWLFNNRRENDPTYAYRRAALHGRTDIVKWIRKRIR